MLGVNLLTRHSGFFIKNNMENNNNSKNTINVGKTAFILAILIVGAVFLFLNINTVLGLFQKIIGILSPIIVGSVMAYIIYPFYNMVYKFVKKHFSTKEKKVKDGKEKKDSDGFAVAIAITASVLVWVLIFIGLIVLVIPELYDSLNTFLSNADSYKDSLEYIISSLPIKGVQSDLKNIFDSLYSSFDNTISTYVLPNISELLPNIYRGVQNVLSMVLNTFIGLIVMIYVLIKKDKIKPSLIRLIYALFKKDVADHILDEFRYANTVFTNFFAGKVLDSLIIMIISYTILSIFKMRYSLLLSVIIGVTNIVPFFGPIVGGVISLLLVTLVTFNEIVATGQGSVLTIAYFGVFVFILQQFDGNILGPKILSDTTGVDSFYVLIATILFGGLFGFVGMIIAVPLWAVLSRLIDEFLVSRLKKKKMPVDVSDY